MVNSSCTELLNYGYVEKLFKLDAADKNINMRLLKDSFTDVNYFLGRPLILSEYVECANVNHGRVYLGAFPVVSIEKVCECRGGKHIALPRKSYSFDAEKQCIIFMPEFDSLHVQISYTAGFKTETFPDELKEAVLELFCKKHSMYKGATDYVVGDEMDDVLEEKLDSGALDFDEFFDEFSSIPYSVEKILKKYVGKSVKSCKCII